MALPEDLQFYFMHFMPYSTSPPDEEKYDSVWVDYPNSLYDPAEGAGYYERYLNEMQLADQLGFDGLVVNEHHSTAYSMMPSCTLMASALAQRTSRAKLCAFGTPVNLTYPNRLAEEYAMLDVMSGGRMEIAFPLGTGMEYWSNLNDIHPATARARFREGVDIIRRAWTEDGPLRYEGEFFNYRYLNVWPKPLQQPHPKLYVMGSGNPATVALAAELGMGYSVTFVPIPAQLAAFQHYREVSERHGRTAQPDDLIVGVFAYVAETDEEADREGRPHILRYFNYNMRTTPRYLLPPGYVSLEEYRKRVQSIATSNVHGSRDWNALTSRSRIVCGSPDTVASAIRQWVEEARCSRVICHLHVGDMPHWKTVKNLTLFAQEVIPRLRQAPLAQPPAGPAGSRRTEEAPRVHA